MISANAFTGGVDDLPSLPLAIVYSLQIFSVQIHIDQGLLRRSLTPFFCSCQGSCSRPSCPDVHLLDYLSIRATSLRQAFPSLLLFSSLLSTNSCRTWVVPAPASPSLPGPLHQYRDLVIDQRQLCQPSSKDIIDIIVLFRRH